jgi:2-iminobutanoate/2-iminopropanoate deaminase
VRQITLNETDLDVPLSWAIGHEDLVFVSGQAALDLDEGEFVGDGVREETALTIENIESILEAAGGSLDDVVKTTVFLTDIDDFDDMNEVYGEYFSEPYPARSAFEVGDLAADIVVEIEAIAAID